MESSTERVDFSPLYGKVALIDGDIFVYRCAFAAEKTKYLVTDSDSYQDPVSFEAAKEAKEYAKGFSSEVWSRKIVEPVENALQAVKTTIEGLLEKTHAKAYRLYLTGTGNFRHEVAVTNPYKDRRQERPKYYDDVRNYLITQYGAIVVNGIEADDALGIDLTKIGRDGFIVSNDKDLGQIVGWHYNWVDNRVYEVSAKQSAHALYTQILAGDATDTVVGIPGIGVVTAAKLLSDSRNIRDLLSRSWDAYRHHFADWPVTKTWAYFIEQANLVYILRKEGERFKPPYIPDECK